VTIGLCKPVASALALTHVTIGKITANRQHFRRRAGTVPADFI
jgi:hypothetical protein